MNKQEVSFWEQQKNGQWKTLTNPLKDDSEVTSKFNDFITTFYWKFRERKGITNDVHPEVFFQGFDGFEDFSKETKMGHCESKTRVHWQELNGQKVEGSEVWKGTISIVLNQKLLLDKLGMDKWFSSERSFLLVSFDELIGTIAHELAHAHQYIINLEKEGETSQCESTGQRDRSGNLLYPELAAEHTGFTSEIKQMIENSAEYQNFKEWWNAGKTNINENEEQNSSEGKQENKTTDSNSDSYSSKKEQRLNSELDEEVRERRELNQLSLQIQKSKSLNELEKNYQEAKSSSVYDSNKNSFPNELIHENNKETIDDYYRGTKSALQGELIITEETCQDCVATNQYSYKETSSGKQLKCKKCSSYNLGSRRNFCSVCGEDVNIFKKEEHFENCQPNSGSKTNTENRKEQQELKELCLVLDKASNKGLTSLVNAYQKVVKTNPLYTTAKKSFADNAMYNKKTTCNKGNANNNKECLDNIYNALLKWFQSELARLEISCPKCKTKITDMPPKNTNEKEWNDKVYSPSYCSRCSSGEERRIFCLECGETLLRENNFFCKHIYDVWAWTDEEKQQQRRFPKEQKVLENKPQNQNNLKTKTPNHFPWWIIFVLLLLVVGGIILWSLFKKKKK